MTCWRRNGRSKPPPEQRAEVLDDDEVDQVLGIGQLFHVRALDGNLPVKALGLNEGASLRDARGIESQTLNQELIIRAQLGGQLAVARAEMNAESALDAGRPHNLVRRLPWFCRRYRMTG